MLQVHSVFGAALEHSYTVGVCQTKKSFLFILILQKFIVIPYYILHRIYFYTFFRGPVLPHLESVDRVVKALFVGGSWPQSFDLLSEPVLSRFMLFHQLSALSLSEDPFLQETQQFLKQKGCSGLS